MPVEALAVDKLIDKAHFHSDVAVAIAEAVDITIRRHNFVTVSAFDARFDAYDAKMEARFTASDAKMEARFAASEANVEARFAASDAKVEARFTALETSIRTLEASFHSLEKSVEKSIEKSIEAAKVWAISLYAALVVFLFGALAANHYWLVNREDMLQARTDQRFERVDARLQRVEARLQRMEALLQQMEARQRAP